MRWCGLQVLTFKAIGHSREVQQVAGRWWCKPPPYQMAILYDESTP